MCLPRLLACKGIRGSCLRGRLPASFRYPKPLLLSTLALAVLPSLGWLLLLGWLKLVHAPALGHLLALVKMVLFGGLGGRTLRSSMLRLRFTWAADSLPAFPSV